MNVFSALPGYVQVVYFMSQSKSLHGEKKPTLQSLVIWGTCPTAIMTPSEQAREKKIGDIYSLPKACTQSVHYFVYWSVACSLAPSPALMVPSPGSPSLPSIVMTVMLPALCPHGDLMLMPSSLILLLCALLCLLCLCTGAG